MLTPLSLLLLLLIVLIAAGEPSDGSFYSDNTKGIVSPLGLFKTTLQVALTKLCGADGSGE